MRNTSDTARWGMLAVIFVALMTVAVVDGGGPPTAEERVQRLSTSYACPVCDGQSVAESNASVARTIREFIATEVALGSSDTEIRDKLVGSYGGEVLLTPRSDGYFSLLWVLPISVLVFGSAAVGIAVNRNRGHSPDPTAEDIALVDTALVETALARSAHQPGPDSETELG